MSMESLALVLALIVGGAWWWMRRAASAGETQPTAAANPYHCVAVTPGDNACPTAQTLKGSRFLSSEAPPLPLPSCSAGRCGCTFTHFEDRRRGDRRNPYSPQTHAFLVHGGDERRGRRGRRHADAMHLA
ncbi:MAG: hypothetical protein KDE68_07985 [Rhodocyclaceae bacterium]|nr:hypothetical protein [Rhodocyclaceae bacterium]